MYWGIKADFALLIIFVIVIIAGFALAKSPVHQYAINVITIMFGVFMLTMLVSSIIGTYAIRNNPQYQDRLNKAFDYEFGPTTSVTNFKLPLIYTVHELNRIIPQ